MSLSIIPPVSRRHFIVGSGVTGLGLATWPVLAAGSPPPVDIGLVKDGKIKFPPWSPDSEPPASGPPNPSPAERRVGFAVVALGKLSLEQILPAFGESKKAKLAGLVSGTPEKMQAVAAQYGIDAAHCYGYDAFDRIKDDPSIEAVYIVLPNALHRDYVIRAAKAGKHVLCEKPMATSSADAREMVQACRDAQVKLMIAYRMQYEPHIREAMRLIKSGELGKVQAISTVNVQALSDPQQWRLNRALSGGGSLPDIGLYCLNTSRALLGEEPVEVTATIHNPPGDRRFEGVEDTISFILRFPSGVIANCLSSYSAHQKRGLDILGETGWIAMDNAYAYEGQQMKKAKRNGIAEAIAQLQIPRKNQFALELDHMAQCILENRTPRTPGEEGLQDQSIMEAIYAAAENRQPVTLAAAPRLDATRGPALEDEL